MWLGIGDQRMALMNTIMNLHSFIHQCLYSPLLGHDLFFSFVIFFYSDDRTPWASDQPVARPLPIHRTTQTHRHPCLWVGLELTIPAFERGKTVHDLDRAATVIGRWTFWFHEMFGNSWVPEWLAASQEELSSCSQEPATVSHIFSFRSILMLSSYKRVDLVVVKYR
jgi:hypothetical protein